MPDEDLDYVVTAGVGTITIRRAHRSNALTRENFIALATMLERAAEDTELRVLVLTGAGERAFCAGADLSREDGFFTRQAPTAATGLGNVIRVARQVGVPIIGRVNGACYAGGMGLLGVCDIAIASVDAKFCLPEIKLGLFPLVVAAVLQDKVPASHLAELIYTGDPIDAHRAAAIGLISRAVPRIELDAAIAALADALGSRPRHAIRCGRGALAIMAGQPLEERLALAEARSTALAQQPETRSLMEAARPPSDGRIRPNRC